MKHLEHSRITTFATFLIVIGFFLFFSRAQSFAAESITKSIEAAADQANQSLQSAGDAASEKWNDIWKRIDEKRLKNRDRDGLVSWAIMGVLAGSMAGLMSILRETSFQRLSNIALGLIGALLGGIIANVSRVDLGMGPVLIRYEDLVFSLAGGVLLVFVVRWVIARRQKKV